MGEGAQIDTIYTDLKAAFDNVNHRLLLLKMRRLGSSNAFVKWLESYLVDRRLCVKLGNWKSATFTNPSGVPQGSNLGPLLFSLYFNDVCLVIPTGCRLVYADDLKIFLIVKSIDDCRQLQKIIDVFSAWCKANCMVISVGKCAIVSFSRCRNPVIWPYAIDGNVIERAASFKDLGVILDTQLTFREHYS